MDPLPVIPTPPAQKWREFRVQFLPAVVFLGTLAAIFYLWREHVLPPTLVAQVEPVVREIRAQQNGILTNLFVDRFQTVREGDVLAEVISTDSRQLDGRLEILRSQISLTQLELSTLLDRERIAFDYHDLRTQYMREQTDLQVARAQLPHQEFDVNLARQLLKEKVVSEFEYQYFLSLYESTKARVEQLTKNVEELETKLESARPLGDFAVDSSATLRQSLARLEAEQKQLESMLAEPVVLRSPIAGVITGIYRQAGETLRAGEPIVTISGVNPERMIGYLRPPYSVDPKPGMKVEVRTRSWKRMQAEAMITGVGAQFEVITNVALLRPNAPRELGLPVSFNIPETLKPAVLGGELVDVIVR